MAIIRLTELKAMRPEDLKKKLVTIEKDIHNEQAEIGRTKKPANAGKYRELKKIRARIFTILKQKALKEPQTTKKGVVN